MWILGPLHIEQNFIKAIGDWLKGSKWTKIYKFSSNTSPGIADSFSSYAGVAGIKRSRYAHQVSMAALFILANDAFQAPLFRHLNSGIAKTGKKIPKEDLRLQRAGLL